MSTRIGPKQDVGILAQPVDGSAAHVIATGVLAKGIWTEGDQLVYSFDASFSRMPLDGGAPELLFAAGADLKNGYSAVSFPTPSAFIFSELGKYSVNLEEVTPLYSADRATGATRQIGSIPHSVRGGIPSGSDVLIDAYSAAFAVPQNGGDARPLASPEQTSWVVGFDESGAYTPPLHRGDNPQIFLSPADGSKSRLFWRNDAPGFQILNLWPVEGGSHVISAVQLLDDGAVHTVLWQVDGAGAARLIACSPQVWDASRQLYALASTPEAFFLPSSLGDGTWTFVRVRR